MSEEVTVEVFAAPEESGVTVKEETDSITDEISSEHADGQTVVSGAPATLTAPTLRVEVLKDMDDNSSFVCTSEDDGGSQQDISDEGERDRSKGNSPTPPHSDFVPPDDELKEKIIKQVEFYFSDANILKDAFLLKHVRRNKMGYVSIKLITSFKKVKSLTKDYRVCAYCLRESDKLEVNEEGTKVRRKDPLPDYDETTSSRTIVAFGLPTDNPTMETVAEIFSKCGDVALIRILRPGKSVPPDIKKNINKHPEIGTAVCAVVEFEKHEHAKKACELNNDSDWRKGMRVVLLATSVPKKKEKLDHRDSVGHHDDDAASEGDPDERKRRKRGAKSRKNRVNELAKENDSSCYSSGSEAEFVPKSRSNSFNLTPNREYDPNHLSPSTSPKSSPMGSPRQRRKAAVRKSPLTESLSAGSPYSPRSSPEFSRKMDSSGGGADSAPNSPWVQRRLLAKGGQPDKSPSGSPRLGRRVLEGSPKMLDMEGVIRQPKGPDGSIGFYGGMGRGKPRSNTIA